MKLHLLGVIESLKRKILDQRMADKGKRIIHDIEDKIRSVREEFAILDAFFSELTPSRNYLDDVKKASKLVVHGEHIELDLTDGSMLMINGQDARMRFLAASPAAMERWLEFEHMECAHGIRLTPVEWPPNHAGTNL